MSYDGAIVSPTPSNTPVVVVGPSSNATTGGILLVATDGAGNLFALTAGVTAHDYGLGPTPEHWATFGALYRQTVFPLDGLDPWLWHGYSGGFLNAANGGNGSGYFAGGTLAIEKDFSNDRLTFITPIGNITRTLSETDPNLSASALNDLPLWPAGHGQQLTRDFTNFPNEDERAHLFDFYQKRDGATFFGFALSAADPGNWGPFQQEAFDQFGAVAGPFPNSSSQLTSRFNQEFSLNSGDFAGTQQEFEWRYIAIPPPMEIATDMEMAPDHGTVWTAFVDVNDSTTVTVSRTFDNGRHWVRHTAFTDPLTSNEFPTLNWFKTWLTVTWSQNGNDIKQAISLDGGLNWNMPSTIPYTGTHPRHIIDKNGGIGLYFFFVGNTLKVARSYDLGTSFVDASPIVVAVGVGAQTIDAEFCSDGSILVSLFVSGFWTKYRSTDLGRTWS